MAHPALCLARLPCVAQPALPDRRTVLKLKLNGKPFDVNAISPTLAKVLAFLDKSPADDLYTAEQLSKLCSVGYNYVRDLFRKSETESYSVIVAGSKYYGNPRAIAELRRQRERASR